jgi:hypothetical protein
MLREVNLYRPKKNPKCIIWDLLANTTMRMQLVDADLFWRLFKFLFFWKLNCQDAIIIFRLDVVYVDLFIKAEASFETFY